MNIECIPVRPHQVHFIVTFANNNTDRLRVADHYPSKLDFPEGILDAFTDEAVKQSLRNFIMYNTKNTEFLLSIFVSVLGAKPVPYSLD
jgi:hypothetical protein